MTKRLFALAAVAAIIIPGGAIAQIVRPAQWTVAKAGTELAADATHNSVQKAVNDAKPGDIIEILDTEVYNEQVTIDSSKHGITIRSRNPTSVRKPTIMYRDTTNRSPKNHTEAGNPGYGPGTSGNFETCGALRIIRASNITIDGIAVDGGGPAPFGWHPVWENKHPLFHGNAAITLAVASGAVIRNCDLHNAYFGVNIKDRNPGGVFGNPNPADNDTRDIIPLSGFGRVGGHLIEHNRIRDNSVAFFSESAWDLGSTMRYNLIYNNFHTDATQAEIARINIEPNNQVSGAFLFKDMVYTPFAIYNNTFYNNAGNFFANWKVSTPHLIFNNIYGKPRFGPDTPTAERPVYRGMSIDHRFPYRMNNSLFSAIDEIQGDNVHVAACAIQSINMNGQQIPGITQVSVSHFFTRITGEGAISEVVCRQDTSRFYDQTIPPHGAEKDTIVPERIVSTAGFVTPGARLTSTLITDDAELRWLETSRSVMGTEDLFVSVDPASPDFLRPIWAHRHVEAFIKERGWPAVGMRNNNGSLADIGAIPHTGRRQQNVVRVKPSNVVLISGGTNATASFFITVEEGGEFNNPRIKFLRWVGPLPEVTDSWGSEAAVVPSGAIRDVPPPNVQLSVGNNSVPFTLPTAMSTTRSYGFFEIVLEGTDAAGNLVTSDVGFLPYRRLEYTLDLKLYDGNRLVTNPTAGQPYRLEITARSASGTWSQVPLTRLTFDLLAGNAAALMYSATGGQCDPNSPLTAETNVPTATSNRDVCFTTAGNTVIMSAGFANDAPFLGTLEIDVLPGTPDKISFLAPVPESQVVAGTQPPAINRGADYTVMVEVQDRYGNAVGPGHSVSISAANVTDRSYNIASVSPASSMTDSAGIAWFTARTDGGVQGDQFRMTAKVTIDGQDKTDTAIMRVGRTLDALVVFYEGDADQSTPDPDVKIEGRVGDWYKVTVKAMLGTELLTDVANTPFIYVEADNPGLEFSATEGGATGNVFPMTGGIATFWVGAKSGITMDIEHACISVTGLRSNSESDPNFGINAGGRCEIHFVRPVTSIEYAVVYGDGHGRPDSIVIKYITDGSPADFKLPDSVAIRWPDVSAVPIAVRGSAISLAGDFTVGVNLRGVSASLPTGHTSISGNGNGLVIIYGGNDGPGTLEDMFSVLDGIGPVVGSDDDGRAGISNPRIMENLNPGVVADTLIVSLSENIPVDLLEGGASLLYTTTPGDPATGGTPLNVDIAILQIGGAFKLVIPPGSGVQAGGYIRVNPAGGVEDVGGNAEYKHSSNPAHVNNRWVQLKLREVPPDRPVGYYTSDPVTGAPDYAYLTFNKKVRVDEWFSGSMFRFETESASTADPTTYVTVVSDDSLTVRIDLAAAWPSGVYLSPASGPAGGYRVRTSRPLIVSISFAGVLDWPAFDGTNAVSLDDMAAPVLADRVVIKAGQTVDDPDTLVATYSESMASGFTDRGVPGSPITIISSGGRSQPTLTVVNTRSVNNFLEVSYVIEPGTLPANLSASDSACINHEANVADNMTPPNVQDAENNRRVPIVMDLGEEKWDPKVSNNPSQDGRPAVIRYTPLNARGSDIKYTAEIIIFDNLGNVVRKWNVKDMVASSIVQDWDGRNDKGRIVGTGIYLVRIVVKDAVIVANNYGLKRHTSKPIKVGFVRK